MTQSAYGDFAWWARERPHERLRDDERRRHVGRQPAPGLLLQNLEADLLSAPTLAALALDLRRCAAAALSPSGRDHLDAVADEVEQHLRARRLYGGGR